MEFKGSHFEAEIILQCVRWYLSYPLSYRNIEEMMLERGVEVDHSTLNRWVLKFTPEIEKRCRKYKKATGGSWRLDETAGINAVNEESGSTIEIRQCKYLNNIVEQDHRRIKRMVDPMMGFKCFKSAKITLGGIEAMAMLTKNQSDIMPLFVRNRLDAFRYIMQ